MQTDKKNFCLRQKRVNIRFYNLPTTINCSPMRKPFIELFTAVIDRDRTTSRLICDNKIFCTTLFWCSLKRSSVKLTKLLVRCLIFLESHFTLTYRSNDLRFVTFWKLTAVTLLLYADWMMVKNASNQRGANSVTAPTKSQPRTLFASKAVFWKTIWRLAFGF